MLMFPKEKKKKKTVKKTKSIMQEDYSVCYLCGRNGYGDHLEEHHIFYGKGNRDNSEKYGLKVRVCASRCHREGPNSIHKNKLVRKMLEREAQMKFEETHTREEFIQIFGKNYL